MSPRCYEVDVDGEVALARFDREPTEEDLAAFRDVVRAARKLFTPEMAERQAAARERFRQRRESTR